MEKVVLAVQFLLLGVASWIDIRTRKIPVWILFFLGLSTIMAVLLNQDRSVLEIGISLLPGLGVFVLSKLSREAVGSGDAWTILLLGPLFGPVKMMFSLCIACFSVSVFSLILLVMKKAKIQSAVPFLPFLTVAVLLSHTVNKVWIYK